MADSPDAELDQSRDEVIQEIYVAFKGVTREGGVSWSETLVIDSDGTMDQRLFERERDTEQSWEDLVDDPTWNADIGIGGFSFLDPIGFRYYIAPAMVRELRGRLVELELSSHLRLDCSSAEYRFPRRSCSSSSASNSALKFPLPKDCDPRRR
jgi:hypothetical protein